MVAGATVHLPGIGDVKKNQALAGAGVAAGVVAFAWWRASMGAAPPSVVDPGVDPVGLSGDMGGGGYSNPAPGGAVADPTAEPAPTTNAAWTQLVSDRLAFTFDGALIQTTLGKYLDRQPLVTNEQLLVRTAWAVAGRPPEGTYPIIPATSTTPSTPTTPALRYPSVNSPWRPAVIKKGETIAQLARRSHPLWTAAQLAALASDAATRSGYPGKANVKFTAARTIQMR